VGYDRPRSLGKDETGSRVAVPIWTSYMGRVLGDSPKEDFPMPDKVVVVPVDLDVSNECVRVVPMAFVKGTEPAACGARRQSVPPVGVPGAAPPTGPGATPGVPGSQTNVVPAAPALPSPFAAGTGPGAPAAGPREYALPRDYAAPRDYTVPQPQSAPMPRPVSPLPTLPAVEPPRSAPSTQGP
jgi:hypothetical protein